MRKYRYDVFISHSGFDDMVAEKLYRTFRENGLHAWLDSECIMPGTSQVHGVEHAIEQSRILLVLVGKEGISPWAEQELARRLFDPYVPLTKGGRYTMKCVDWFVNDEKNLLRSFLAIGSVVTPDVAPKYLNTVEFFRHIRKLKESRRTEGK